MAIESALRGTPALLVACLLLFVEEAGVPTPAPGEVFLIGVGLLLTAGGVQWWIALGACWLAVAAGAMTGYAAARLVGLGRLRAVARRVGLELLVERASDRLRRARSRDVGVSRLIPGLRIMTTLVAGALDVDASVFFLGMAPASAAWVIGYVVIGVFIGVPAERLVGDFEAFGLRLVAILVVLGAGYAIVRRVPARAGRVPRPNPPPPRDTRRRVAAYAIDVVTIAGAVALLDAVTGLELGDLDAPLTTTVVLTGLSILYVVIARRSRGRTLGERLVNG